MILAIVGIRRFNLLELTQRLCMVMSGLGIKILPLHGSTLEGVFTLIKHYSDVPRFIYAPLYPLYECLLCMNACYISIARPVVDKHFGASKR